MEQPSNAYPQAQYAGNAFSYTQSLQEAKGHGKALIRSTIGQHPVATAVALGVMLVLVLVLIYVAMHYKAKCKSGKSGFDTHSPKWSLGSADAGDGGSMHRDLAPAQISQHSTSLRHNACAPGEAELTWVDAESGLIKSKCVKAQNSGQLKCKGAWDAAATAEAQALATVGSFQHDDYGEDTLQGAINSAYDERASKDEMGQYVAGWGGSMDN
jgi:hypothetical protein